MPVLLVASGGTAGGVAWQCIGMLGTSLAAIAGLVAALALLRAAYKWELGRARVVAEAAGGILGVLWNVSETEKHVIAQLEAAFP